MAALETVGYRGAQCDVAALSGSYGILGLMAALETVSSPGVKGVWLGHSMAREW